MTNIDRLTRALLSASALVAFVPTAAFAQDEEPTVQSSEGTAIVVTGSRISGAAPVGSAVTALGRDEIAASGAVTVDRIIKEIPQVFDLGVSESSRAQSGGNGNITYGNSVNLRGIGPYATLVLIDGHRAISNSRSIDPSILPSLGIERIEVIADGASAIYGSDAIAGVVNLIPRRSLDGGEVLARYGTSEDGDFDEWQVGAALGKVWDGGQIMVAYEHVYRSNLAGDDRSFFVADQREFGGSDYRTNRCAPGTISAGGVNYAIPAGGVTQATANLLLPGTQNLCNLIIDQDLFPEQEYDTVNATGTLEVANGVELFFDGFWSRRKFYRQNAEATATITVPQTNAFFVRPAGFAGDRYTIAYNFMNDIPSDDAWGFAKSWEITPGIRARLFGDWQVEALYTHGENKDLSDQRNGLNNAALNTALASSNPATAFDPYGLGRTSQAILDLLHNQIFYAPTLNRFDGYEFRLNGTLFDLPGGAVKLAAGYEGQEMEVELGVARGNPDTPLVYRPFSRRVDSAYGELLVPIFGPGNAVPGFQRLVLDAAVRYDHYDDVGSTTNPKIGVDWSPVDALTIRGSYGTSFRAPLISQIYGNSNALFGQDYTNPAGGTQITGFALSAPNLDLGPETATTWSLGFEYNPTSAFRLGATYWNVEYKNQIETYLGDLNILTRESEFEGTGIILHGAAAAARVKELLAQGITLARGSFPGGNPDNVILFVDGRNNNLGRSKTKGIDFFASYALPTESAGTFTFNVSGTYLLDYKVSITPNGTMVDRRNFIFQPLTFKARGSVAWEKGDIDARLVVTHVGGYTNDGPAVDQKVDSYTPVDLSLAWTPGRTSGGGILGGGLTLGVEVRDLFDIGPPYVNIAPGVNGSGGYDASAASPIGRTFAASARLRW